MRSVFPARADGAASPMNSAALRFIPKEDLEMGATGSM
jgi:hypothetical protein